jgi:hypothetical protein
MLRERWILIAQLGRAIAIVIDILIVGLFIFGPFDLDMKAGIVGLFLVAIVCSIIAGYLTGILAGRAE